PRRRAAGRGLRRRLRLRPDRHRRGRPAHLLAQSRRARASRRGAAARRRAADARSAHSLAGGRFVVSLRLADIPTPAALIDEARMTRNIARMQERMRALGARLRPHVKTPKCVEVARRQQPAGARAITVSTLKEAEEFFAAGFSDILYAVCIAPQKLDRVLALR